MNGVNKRRLDADNDLDALKSPKLMKTASACDDLLDGIDFDDFGDDDFCAAEASAAKPPARSELLDLTTWRRCIVTDTRYDGKLNALIIQGNEDVPRSSKAPLSNEAKPMLCHLQFVWASSKIDAGDVVSIVGVWNEQRHAYCVTLDEGFCVVRPDLLVSGTTVVGGLFCMRKAILSDRFKGIEAAVKIMTVGTIVHKLFEIVLRQRLTTREQIRAASEKMLADEQMSYTLYSSSMTSAEARKEFDGFLDKIHNFMRRYIEGVAPPPDKRVDEFTGRIDEICDIEENIWLPKFGLKGKIDVSVKASHGPGTAARYMPIELKTGKASFSAEHTGQLIIYQVMMSEIEQSPVGSGLLLYLRDGVMREIKGKHTERRDLVILRNEISYYLSRQHEAYNKIGRKTADATATNDHDDAECLTELLKVSNMPDLPEPINRANVCAQCPYNVLCSMYLNRNTQMLNELDRRHPLRELGPAVTSHLTDAHIEYFCHWVGLMALEDQESRKVNPMKSMWLETPEYREMNGNAIGNLTLKPNVIAEDSDAYVHEFVAVDKDVTSYGFSIGAYLIVSSSKRYAVASGRCVAVEASAIKLQLERNLCERYSGEIFTIDKYETQTSATFNMSNLGALLDDTDESAFLRKVVIDRARPTFTKTLPKVITTTGMHILKSLNSDQRTAVLKALTANDYLLLKGLPGTGKTQTLAALIRLLVLMKQSVLITSHTHSAVDNVLVRLMKSDRELKFLRLGSSKRIRADLNEHSEGFYTQNCESPDELKTIYEQFDVVGVTCLGSGHPLLTQRKFDVCLVDESTQVLQSTVLRPLFSAKKIILVGDPDQLPPIVRSQMARKLGADESLFARLNLPGATATLCLQYRMNKVITKLANDLTYQGALKCADEHVASATLKLKSSSKQKWVLRTLSSHIDQSVIFLNTANVYDLNQQYMDGVQQKSSGAPQKSPSKLKSSRLYTNYYEAAIILQIVKDLKAMGVESKMIGVIAPYALQVELLRTSIQRLYDADIEVNTVDQYQGRDKEVIIYSCTQSKSLSQKIKFKSSEKRKCNEILEDQRRLTVAITRAKHKFIMIGDMATLAQYGPFRRLLDNMNDMSKIHLADQQQGFHWQHLLSVFDSVHV